jgi:glycosyltransferase involved in cell wall biosynthesis
MKISVIIPCYNCVNFIDRAVSSVFSQKIKNYEIILIDNNSTDQTLVKLHLLQENYPNLITVLTEQKKGAPAARNKGLLVAKGEFIQFLDADDELQPEKIGLQLEMAESINADVVIGNHVLVYLINGKVKTHIKYANPLPWEGLITSNLGITSSILWKREALLKVGGWDTSLTSSQEYNLLFSLLKADARFAHHPGVLTNIHKSDSSISKSSDNSRLQQIINNRINLRIEIRVHLQHKGLLTSQLNRLIDTYIYNELMTWRDTLPEYVSRFFKNNSLDVSKSYVFKTQIRRMFKV